MLDAKLCSSVERLATVLHATPDAAMGREWVWGDYNEEGVRFTGFVAYGHMRELAALVAAERVRIGSAPTLAQRILAQYQLAYRDMHALMLGIDAASAEIAPADGEWSLHQVVTHMVEADVGFYAMVQANIERHRNGIWSAEKIRDAEYEHILGLEEPLMAIINGPLDGLYLFHTEIHARIMADLAQITDSEMELPARFWEEALFPIRFRLQRFEAHLRQHSIQLESTLIGIGRPPTEGSRIARLLYAGLAELEGCLIGAPETAAAAQTEAGEVIAEIATAAEQALRP
ncbi:MAG: DinB family protein [Roseiflexaceae bacterium]|nr:DinB family protein [Roseiflexaceae bacterium]